MARFVSLLLLVALACITISTCEAKISAILIFGDSTVDPGNNDYIETFFRSNHAPYGLNFPGRLPTGRFSDGLLVTDYLASRMGIKQLVPAFLDPKLTDYDLQTGVSFASAGSGYDDLTTAASGVIPVSKQPGLFKSYLTRLVAIVGEERADEIVKNALFLISAGTNDLLFNFFDLPTRRGQFDMSGYQDFLHKNLQTLVQELHDLGARKVAISGLPPIGCIPFQLSAKFEVLTKRSCIPDQNRDSQLYNSKLERLVPAMQSSHPGIKIVYVNIYDPLLDMVQHPYKYGFEVSDRGCCGTGLVEVGPLCNMLTPTCANASKYIFWDSIHPTQKAGEAMAQYLAETVLPLLD